MYVYGARKIIPCLTAGSRHPSQAERAPGPTVNGPRPTVGPGNGPKGNHTELESHTGEVG